MKTHVLFVGTVHDYLLVTGSSASAAVNDINRSEVLQSTAAQSVQGTSSASASLIPPPRPPPPRLSPQRRQHHSSHPPALPPKERHGTTPIVTESTEKPSSSHLVPPPLPQPRQKCKEMSPVGCSKSAVADRLASKVLPPLPVDARDDTERKIEVGLTPSALTDFSSLTTRKCDGNSVKDPTFSLKGRTVPRASSDCDWSLDTATSSTKGSLGPPLDRASATECSVCLERQIDSVLYTCGHMCMCYECAVGVRFAGTEGGSCPICRQPIKDVIRIYRS